MSFINDWYNNLYNVPFGLTEISFIMKNDRYQNENNQEFIKNKCYIKTTPLIISNKTYLVDSNGIIWSHDNNNEILGRKINDNIIWIPS